MGLTSKLNECIEEVDVIIAGGTSDMPRPFHLEAAYLTMTISRRHCRVCGRWASGRGGPQTFNPCH